MTMLSTIFLYKTSWGKIYLCIYNNLFLCQECYKFFKKRGLKYYQASFKIILLIFAFYFFKLLKNPIVHRAETTIPQTSPIISIVATGVPWKNLTNPSGAIII